MFIASDTTRHTVSVSCFMFQLTVVYWSMVKATKTKQDCTSFGVTLQSVVVWRHIWEKIGGLLVHVFIFHFE